MRVVIGCLSRVVVSLMPAGVVSMSGVGSGRRLLELHRRVRPLLCCPRTAEGSSNTKESMESHCELLKSLRSKLDYKTMSQGVGARGERGVGL